MPAIMPKRKRGVEEAPAIERLDPDFPPALKRRCLGDPDVTVVVGGTAFMHHSFILCYASEYFDTMLSSGMQESENKRIEFPDKKPADWKLFYPFLEPRSLSTAHTVRVTKDNAKAVLPWFHEFDMADLLHESDEKLWSSLLLFKRGYYPSNHRSLPERKATLMEIMEWTAMADMYGLQKTRQAMKKELMKAIADFPELIQKDLLQGMVPFWSKPDDRDLWLVIKSKLPADVTSNNSDSELQSNPLFLDMLTQSFKVASLEKGHHPHAAEPFTDPAADDAVARLLRPVARFGDVRNAAQLEFDDLIRHHGLAYRQGVMRRRQVAAARIALRGGEVDDNLFDGPDAGDDARRPPFVRPEVEELDANQHPPPA